MKIKSFECHKSIRNYKKNNAWNIRCLVDESFVPVNQQTCVLYCRLSDLKRHARSWSWLAFVSYYSITHLRAFKTSLSIHLVIVHTIQLPIL